MCSLQKRTLTLLFIIMTLTLSNRQNAHCYLPLSQIVIDPKAKVTEIGHVAWTDEELRAGLEEFANLYKKRPIYSNVGGMFSTHMFYTWFLVKKLQPETIIESGVYKGQSTWLFEQAAPYAKIIGIDPFLSQRVYISPRVMYSAKDFSKHDWSKLDKEKTLCFFDDHQGVKRIKQCQNFGFKHIIYEDNFAYPGGNYEKNALSVKAAFLMQGDEAQYLRSACDVYYEFPPVLPNSERHGLNFARHRHATKHPLLTKVFAPHHKQFAEDAWHYFWLAYVRLK